MKLAINRVEFIGNRHKNPLKRWIHYYYKLCKSVYEHFHNHRNIKLIFLYFILSKLYLNKTLIIFDDLLT